MAKSSLGKAYVQIVPSADGIAGSITKVLKGESSSAGESAGSNIVSKIKDALTNSKIRDALLTTLNLGAELEQNLGGTEAVFGEFATSIQETATEAYKNMGLSASDYMATANKMGSLFQGSGVSQERSLELTSSAMQRAADVASVMGIDATMAMESIAGAAKGNFTMMDNLGVAMNATSLEAYALEKGMKNFSYSSASTAEKAELAMQMFMERTAQYAGNYAKEAEGTYSGSFEAMKAAASNVLGNLALGEDITPSLKALVKTTVTFVSKNLVPAVLNVIKALPSGIIVLVKELAENLKELIGQSSIEFSSELFSSGIQMIVNLANGIFSGLPKALTSIGNILTSICESIMAALPELLEQGKNLIFGLAQGIWENLPEILLTISSVMGNLLYGIASHLPEVLQKGIEIIFELAAGLIKAIPDLIIKLPEIMNAMEEKFMEFDWQGLGWDIISGIAQGIVNGVGSVINAAVEAAKGIYNAVAGFFDVHSPSKKFEWIGLMNDKGLAKGTLGGIGEIESATEKVMNAISKPFDTTLTLSTAANMPTSLSGLSSIGMNNSSGYSQQINIYSPKELSPSEVARQTRNATRQMALQLSLGK